MSAQEWLPWAIPSGIVTLITTPILMIYRSKLVPKGEVDRIERDKQQMIAVHERIVTIYKDAADKKQQTIDELSASVSQLAEAQRATHSLIQGLAIAAEAARSGRASSNQEVA
jgi:hypothetical protein